MRTKRAIAALAALAALAGCEERGPQIDVESSIPVRVEPVRRQAIAEYVTATATALAVREGVLRSQQGGRYRLQVNPRTGAPWAMGDQVRAGELLVRLANEEFENQVAIEARRLQLAAASREYEKQQGLYARGGITLREVTEAERALIDARYASENAELQLAKLRLKAPYDGLIAELPHHSPEEVLEAGAVLARVADCAKLYADLSLAGKEIARIVPGQRVLVTHYDGATADTLVGRVAQVAPVIQADSRTFTARIVVPNEAMALRPGMFIRADVVVVERDSALVIPSAVVIDAGEQKTVFVVEKGLALERRLELGLSNREQVEVLSGLEEDERLVVEGFETLRDRSRVKLEKGAGE